MGADLMLLPGDCGGVSMVAGSLLRKLATEVRSGEAVARYLSRVSFDAIPRRLFLVAASSLLREEAISDGGNQQRYV